MSRYAGGRRHVECVVEITYAISKRLHDSQAPASSSDGLVERLKAAGNDVVLLREIIETNDSGSIAAAFAALLAGPSSEAISGVKRRKKTPNRPCPSTPNETLVEIMLFADRDALDALQLVCHFMLEFIRDREAKLPLRSISRVRIGKCSRPKHFRDVWKEHWLPFVGVARNSNIKEALMPKTIDQLVPYLRVACCASVCIDLRWSRSVRSERRETASGAVFGDLVVPSTSINVLKVHVDDGSVAFALRAFEAFKFKPQSKVVVKAEGDHDWASSFDEAFFTSAAECGVRSIKFETGSRHRIDINVLPALSFGFAEPTTGGDRSISSVFCDLEEDNFLEQLVKKIDFKFTIEDLSESIDDAGFEKYHKDEFSWLVNDLENGITVEISEAELSTEIHVFSSGLKCQ